MNQENNNIPRENQEQEVTEDLTSEFENNKKMQNTKKITLIFSIIGFILGSVGLTMMYLSNQPEFELSNGIGKCGDEICDENKTTDNQLQPQWSQHAYDAANTGQSPYIGPQTNNIYWKFTEGLDSCNFERVYTSPVIDYNGNLYFGSSNGSLFKLTPEKELIWKHTIPDAYDRYECASGEDAWYTAGGLYDLNIMWEPAMDNETIYFGTSGKKNDWGIYALDIKTGQKKWKYSLSAPLDSQLKIYKNRLYFSTLNLETKESHIYSISNNGDDAKSYSLGFEIKGNSPGIFNDVLYVGSEDGLLAFDLPLNKPKWTYSN